MRTGLAVRLAGWSGACLLGLVLTTPAQAAPPTTTTTTGTGTMGAPAFPALPMLTPAEQAQLMMEAITVVDMILSFTQMTLPADEEMFLVEFVYRLFEMLAVFEMFSGSTTAMP